jgi:type II secretory ATPase GspE/PulE/Tfp pilus assembly ATPase PilB-like protein
MADVADTSQFEGAEDFGQFLVEQKLLTDAQRVSAQAHKRQHGTALTDAIVSLEMMGEEQVTRAHAQHLDIPYINLKEITLDPSVLPMVDAAFAKQYELLPIGRKPDGTLRLAVADWTDEVMKAAARIGVSQRVRIAPALATAEHIRQEIERSYQDRVLVGAVVGAASIPEIRNAANPGDPNAPKPPIAPPGQRSSVPALLPPSAANSPARFATPPAAIRKPGEGGQSPGGRTGVLTTNQPEGLEEADVDQPMVIQLVNTILSKAIKAGASDIHFEPRRDTLDIRYRIDGTLHHVDSIRREFQAACTSRVKIMADMNIAERRVPQDGRIAVTLDNRAIDMRVSSLPTQYGESIVLRILDKGGRRPGLDQLGFSERNLKLLNNLIRKPHGIFLATGPTGSGKTTTLYSAIQAIHTPEVNIITVEDPIEYDLDGIRQSNVHEKAGLTMAKQLRAILRQDPDIIYVGEIRDSETAEIAFRAALTGHMVFSTLHCNDASGAVTRLLNMDVDPFLVASSVVGVMAQRLVRKVCVNCAMPTTPDPEMMKSFGVHPDSPEARRATFVIGRGCDVCEGTGYKGRASIQEIMGMDDNIRNMVLARIPSNKIRKAAMAHGMVSMREDAAQKVMAGMTTFEEAAKRVFIDDTEELPEISF